VFGASGKINIAYYEALTAMAQMGHAIGKANTFTASANSLKESILKHLCNTEINHIRMSDSAPANGISQDVAAFAITTGIVSPNSTNTSILHHDGGSSLPTAYQNIPGWDRVNIASPYATGFAAEALFSSAYNAPSSEPSLADTEGVAAVKLIKALWGIMADPASDNYSGGHWEALTVDGKPFMHDVSLHHGWSTWPVFLLPKYLGGLSPVEPGWKRFVVKPVFVGLSAVDVSIDSVSGKIEVSIRVEEATGKAEISVVVPVGTIAELKAPSGWVLKDAEYGVIGVEGQGTEITVSLTRQQ
jgi:hypothetical protein